MQKHNNAAFIDYQNLYMSLVDQGWKLDQRRFRVYLEEKYGVASAYLFIGYMPENQALYKGLQKAGFILIFKEVLKHKNGTIKGNVDAELVLNAMIEYPNYNQAVIVTGDGDFACLVDYLRHQGKLRMLLVPNRAKYSALLKKAAAQQLDSIDNLKVKLAYKKNTP